MEKYLAEFVGTAILLLLGNGVCANVTLAKSKAKGGGWIVVATAWGLAVAMAVYAVGRISGAHINPAVTVSLAVIGDFPWVEVPGYLAAQLAGAFAGATLVWLAFLAHWKETEDPEAKLGVFCHHPGNRQAGCQLPVRGDRDRDAPRGSPGHRRQCPVADQPRRVGLVGCLQRRNPAAARRLSGVGNRPQYGWADRLCN